MFEFVVGVLTGMAIVIIIDRVFNKKIVGIIAVDHDNGLCKFTVTSDEISNSKNKQVIFNIDHSAKISRKEPPL